MKGIQKGTEGVDLQMIHRRDPQNSTGKLIGKKYHQSGRIDSQPTKISSLSIYHQQTQCGSLHEYDPIWSYIFMLGSCL